MASRGGSPSRSPTFVVPWAVLVVRTCGAVRTLVDAGVVPASWDTGSQGGIATRSIVVFVVRKGNPMHIHGWTDLVKPRVQVITPKPFSSGGASWNIMAAYGAQLQQGKTEQQALDYLRELLRHLPVQDKSARESLQTFDSGKGDVLLSYENEAITGEQKGAAIDYVIPDQTILIENPIAVTKSAPEPAEAFVRFLRTPAAQKIFAANGYRPVLDNLRSATHNLPSSSPSAASAAGPPSADACSTPTAG